MSSGMSNMHWCHLQLNRNKLKSLLLKLVYNVKGRSCVMIQIFWVAILVALSHHHCSPCCCMLFEREEQDSPTWKHPQINSSLIIVRKIPCAPFNFIKGGYFFLVTDREFGGTTGNFNSLVLEELNFPVVQRKTQILWRWSNLKLGGPLVSLSDLIGEGLCEKCGCPSMNHQRVQ
jgi:hypothetical protein